MIVGAVIYACCALLVIGLGVSQWNSKKPVGFYSGVEAPAAEELTDVKAWNQRHGLMWIVYGGILMLCGLAGAWMGDGNLLCLIPFGLGPILPIAFLVWYHERLTKKYRRNP